MSALPPGPAAGPAPAPGHVQSYCEASEWTTLRSLVMQPHCCQPVDEEQVPRHGSAPSPLIGGGSSRRLPAADGPAVASAGHNRPATRRKPGGIESGDWFLT